MDADWYRFDHYYSDIVFPEVMPLIFSGTPATILDVGGNVGKFALMDVDRNDGQSLELANAVAERLSAHIESLRQFDQTQSALAQAEKLFEASRVLTQAKDLEELLQVVAGSLNIPEINRATLGIFHYGKENELENMTVTANWWNGTGNKPTDIGRVYPVNVFRTFSLFSSPAPLFTNDAFSDPRVDAPTLELAKRQNLRAVAVLPL